jgi:hypothetical protein
MLLPYKCLSDEDSRLMEDNMNEFVNSMAGVAWSIIPILLIFFLMSGIMFVFYFKVKIEEISIYLKSIAASLERLSNRRNDY